MDSTASSIAVNATANLVIAEREIYATALRTENEGLRGGANYTANDSTFPTEITFTNGRTVGIAFDGDKPYLTVSAMEDQNGL